MSITKRSERHLPADERRGCFRLMSRREARLFSKTPVLNPAHNLAIVANCRDLHPAKGTR